MTKNKLTPRRIAAPEPSRSVCFIGSTARTRSSCSLIAKSPIIFFGFSGVWEAVLTWNTRVLAWAAAFEPLSSYRLTDTRGMHRNYTSGLLQNLLGLSLNLQWNSGTFLLNFFFSDYTHMILIWYHTYMILFHFQKKLVKSVTVLL